MHNCTLVVFFNVQYSISRYTASIRINLRKSFRPSNNNAYNTMYIAFYEFCILTSAAGIDPAESGSDPAFSGSDNKNTF